MHASSQYRSSPLRRYSLRILIYDIETSRNTVQFKTFGLIKEGFFKIPHDAILIERNILTASWKWKGDRKPQSIAIDPKRPTNDKHIVKKMYQLFSEADEIVAHYGDKFDAKYIRGRGLIHGLPPPPPVRQIDTYKIAKARFNLNSNKLDYLGKVLGLGGKIKTSEALWEGCENGDVGSIRNMVKYNNQDVDLLDKVHTILAPYAAAVYTVMRGDSCPYCGSKNLQSRGMDPKKEYRRYQCLDCFKWPRKAA